MWSPLASKKASWEWACTGVEVYSKGERERVLVVGTWICKHCHNIKASLLYSCISFPSRSRMFFLSRSRTLLHTVRLERACKCMPNRDYSDSACAYSQSGIDTTWIFAKERYFDSIICKSWAIIIRTSSQKEKESYSYMHKLMTTTLIFLYNLPRRKATSIW